jgi:hypothetical protein
MSHALSRPRTSPGETLPTELIELRERVHAQPEGVRAELEPLLDEVMEHARFRSRVIDLAREALERFHLDLKLARFDLDATRREREALRRLVQGDRGNS